MENKTWITNKGEEIQIVKMSDLHIQNCIMMIERSKYKDLFEVSGKLSVNYEEYKNYLPDFVYELKRRKENES